MLDCSGNHAADTLWWYYIPVGSNCIFFPTLSYFTVKDRKLSDRKLGAVSTASSKVHRGAVGRFMVSFGRIQINHDKPNDSDKSCLSICDG